MLVGLRRLVKMLIAAHDRGDVLPSGVEQRHALPCLDPADHMDRPAVRQQGCQLGAGQGEGQHVVVAPTQRGNTGFIITDKRQQRRGQRQRLTLNQQADSRRLGDMPASANKPSEISMADVALPRSARPSANCGCGDQ